MGLTCSFDVMTCALAIGWEVAFVVTMSPPDFPAVEPITDLALGSGFCALALAVLPYTSRALLVMFMMRLMS